MTGPVCGCVAHPNQTLKAPAKRAEHVEAAAVAPRPPYDSTPRTVAISSSATSTARGGGIWIGRGRLPGCATRESFAALSTECQRAPETGRNLHPALVSETRIVAAMRNSLQPSLPPPERKVAGSIPAGRISESLSWRRSRSRRFAVEAETHLVRGSREVGGGRRGTRPGSRNVLGTGRGLDSEDRCEREPNRKSGCCCGPVPVGVAASCAACRGAGARPADRSVPLSVMARQFSVGGLGPVLFTIPFAGVGVLVSEQAALEPDRLDPVAARVGCDDRRGRRLLLRVRLSRRGSRPVAVAARGCVGHGLDRVDRAAAAADLAFPRRTPAVAALALDAVAVSRVWRPSVSPHWRSATVLPSPTGRSGSTPRASSRAWASPQAQPPRPFRAW